MPSASWPRRAVLAILLAAAGVLAWYAQSRLLAPARCIRILETETTPVAANAALRAPGSLRVATSNVAHARGGVFGASNWTGASRAELDSHLEALSRQVSDTDILVLNEVDFDASWSRSIDQAAAIAARAGLRHLVEQRNVDVALPFRTYRFGNAILSRYPIVSAQPIRFPPYSKLEAALAGNHDGVVATIATPLGPLDVIAVHLEYRSEAVRLRCAAILQDLVRASAHPVLAMGDFNSLPGFARKHAEYVAPPENAVDLLLGSGALALSSASVDWSRYATFPSARPDRAIDWILTSPQLEQGEPTVVQSDLSDHLMVAVSIRAREPRPSAPGNGG